jgi:hypothetical protein
VRLWRSGGVAAVGVAGERAHAPRSTEHAASDSGQSSASPLQAFGCSTPIMAFDMEKELADNDFNKVIQDVEEVIYHATAKPGSGLSVDHAAELAKAKHSLKSNMRLLVSSPHTQPQLREQLPHDGATTSALRSLWTVVQNTRDSTNTGSAGGRGHDACCRSTCNNEFGPHPKLHS